MKLFNCFAAPGYHTSIITTFGVDFEAYESIALPRLREAGCNNNVLIADARMLSHSMGDGFRRPKFAGRRYSVVGVHPQGVFHPKLILQLGKTSGRLLVASANMTAAGLAGNLEVVGEVMTGEDDRLTVPILRAAFEYLSRLLESPSVARRQIDWAMKRTRWLSESLPGEGVVELSQGGVLAFLASSNERGIGARFTDLVRGRSVKRLIVISPYWDSDLKALRELKNKVAPKKMAVLVQPRSALFPVHKWPIGSGASLFDVTSVKGTTASRFAHAKVIIAETRTADCVLYGSANCTEAALGSERAGSINEEVCLYRELGPGEAVKRLGLESALSESMAIQASDLPSYKPGDEIPMADLHARLPGRFELCGQLLYWWPPARQNPTGTEVLLFDQSGAPIAARLIRTSSGSMPVAYQCEFQEHPYFAQVRAKNFESSVAIIVIERAIQEAQRRSTSRKVENALAHLDDEEAFEGLWLLEVIQKLDAAERDFAAASADAKPSRGASKGQDEEGASRQLTYEQFIAGRKAAGAVGRQAGSHLASSHQESVRSFLNALIGHRRSQLLDSAEEDQTPAPNLSLGDETTDGEQALEQDDRFGSDAQLTTTAVDASKKRLRRQHQYVKDTQASVAAAVERFIQTSRAEASARTLGVVDLLRLRVLLMVVLGAGSKKLYLIPKEVNAMLSRRQVLPSAGEVSWRRLVGKLLFGFFRNHGGSSGPLIDRVALDVEAASELPDDVMECWASCYWALCATRVAVDEKGCKAKVSDFEQRIAADLYRHTRLLSDEALGNPVQVVFAGMSSRYGERIGVHDGVIWNEHRHLVAMAQELATENG